MDVLKMYWEILFLLAPIFDGMKEAQWWWLSPKDEAKDTVEFKVLSWEHQHICVL